MPELGYDGRYVTRYDRIHIHEDSAVLAQNRCENSVLQRAQRKLLQSVEIVSPRRYVAIEIRVVQDNNFVVGKMACPGGEAEPQIRRHRSRRLPEAKDFDSVHDCLWQ